MIWNDTYFTSHNSRLKFYDIIFLGFANDYNFKEKTE